MPIFEKTLTNDSKQQDIDAYLKSFLSNWSSDLSGACSNNLRNEIKASMTAVLKNANIESVHLRYKKEHHPQKGIIVPAFIIWWVVKVNRVKAAIVRVVCFNNKHSTTEPISGSTLFKHVETYARKHSIRRVIIDSPVKGALEYYHKKGYGPISASDLSDKWRSHGFANDNSLMKRISKSEGGYVKSCRHYVGRDGVKRRVYMKEGKSYVKKRDAETGVMKYRVVRSVSLRTFGACLAVNNHADLAPSASRRPFGG